MLLSTLLFVATLATAAFSACDRDLLKTAANALITAQSVGNITQFSILSSNVTYLENNSTANIRTGILMAPKKIDLNRSFYDTEACKTFTEYIITDPKHPYVVGTQMYLSNGQVSKIDSLVTDKGDWLFNATGYLYWESLEHWTEIPLSNRDTRTVIKAAADAYLDRCNDASVVVPFGTPCARLEGGAYTGQRNASENTCNLGLPSHTPTTNRRYVVDEVMGSVDVFLGFTGLDRTRPNDGAPDSHLFRVEGGKIRYIHTVSYCWTDGCGINGTFPPGQIRRGF